jgi:hypothetical protein
MTIAATKAAHEISMPAKYIRCIGPPMSVPTTRMAMGYSGKKARLLIWSG